MFSRHYRVLATCLLFVFVQTAWAVEIELTLDNGNVIRGELVSQNKQTVILKVVGIETRYERSAITKYERILTPAEEYEAKRSELKDDDLEGRYKLASWLYQPKQAYNLAEKELVSLQKDFPQDPRVPILLKIVRNKRTLQTEDTGRVTTTPVRVKPDKTSPTTTTTVVKPDKTGTEKTGPAYSTPLVPEPATVLTDDQINLIKVYEVNLNNRPNIIFKRPDLVDFLNANVGVNNVPKNKQEREYFLNRLEGYQQLEILFKAKARDYYDKARVLGDPEVFKEFKTLHRTYIQNRCATTDCHGGDVARGIFLFNRRPNTTADQIVYTNFLILNNYTATKGGLQYDMIDRADPDRSLFLQFGMITEDAVYPHPPVRGMQPAFLKGRDDRQYITIRNWIQSLYNPTPEYGVDYKLSGSTLPAQTLPAEPATKP